jgi:tetratricopeptide (TPR) repeat protein
MGDRSPDRMQALGRAALALLIEAVKELVPAFGPIQAAWEAYHDALRPEDLPDRVREMLQQMSWDYRRLLEPELRAQAGDTVAIALREAIGILDESGLSPEELAAEAGLDPQEAARRTREWAAHRLERLDERARSLAERMIEDYYRVLLSHRDALAYVGIPALQELLRRTEGLATRLLAALDLQRWREAWAALLPVARPLPGPLHPENLLEALRAPYRLVEFTGKAHRALGEEIAGALKGPGPHPSRAWVLWGPGGAGKTRTAVEVALALKAAGWQAFFVPPPFLPVGWASYLPIWSRPDRPTLLIVDYAEQRPAEELRALAGAVGEAASKRSAPLALLFLMRADPREAVAGHVAEALAEARIRWEARRVPPVEDPEDRQALFREARARFRAALAPPDAPPEVDYEPEALPRTPLALLALAVLAAHGHRVVQSRDEAAILTDLWEQWEQPRWKRTLEAQGGRELLQTPEVWKEARARIEQALAAASLGRPFAAPEEVAAWWEAYFPFRKRTARGERLDPSWLAERLKVLFPGVGEAWRLPPISPDPLADVALARFGADLGRLVDSILPAPEEIEKASLAIRRLVEGWEHGEALSPEQLGGLMIWIWPVDMVREVLPRLSAAAVPGASEAAQAALEAATCWLEKTVEVLPQEVAAAWLGTWGRLLPPPDRTVLLRPFEEVAYRSWVKRAIDEAERARALGMWGFALSALGRREEALKATQEAVEIYRRLADRQPDAFLPDLAASLHNLGKVLSALGRRAEALQAAQEAVEIRRRLAAQHPDAFLPDLARSLNNLGAMLSEMGRRAEALQATQEAVDLYRRLAQQNPDAFLPDLAVSLNNLGADLSALGRRAEALEATQEAVEHYRRLAAQHPDAFLPYLAISLHNLGAMLSEMGRRAEALEATQEAVDLYRRLAAQHPDAFLPDLAASLNNLGLWLSEMGRRAEALEATQEAVEIRRRLAQQHPDAFLPDLAASLHNLGAMLSEMGRRAEALQATQEAVDLYRRLAAQHPDAFLPDLARSLHNLGLWLSEMGRRAEALEATQEAVEHYRRLAAQHPDAFLPDLARSLHNLGNRLSALGRWAEALQATREAVDLYRRLAAQHPDAFLPYLAASLHNLGVDLSALGRRAEALQATQEAVEIRRRLAAQHPDAFLPDLAMSLTNLGVDLSALGRRAEALQATQEAVDLYRRLAAQHPDAFLPYLAMSLTNLGIWLSEMGRREEALQAAQEAVDLYRRLAAQHPDAFLPDLAMSLNNLGAMLSEMGRRAEALQATQEAVDLYRRLAQQNPDAFLPDLAESLGAYGKALLGLGRAPEAREAFAEGLRILLPFVQKIPAAFRERADELLQGYLRACEEAGEAPDEALVAQVRRAIE